jgi:hypothetical protein
VPANRPIATRQVFRRLTLGSGPLKRASDHLEFLARLILACSLLAAAPISLAVATATYTQAQDEAAREAADRHTVPAELQEDVPVSGADVWLDGPQAEGTAVWTDPDGTTRRGTVIVSLGARAGDTVLVWFDGDGNRTTPPLNAADVTARAASQGCGTFVVLCLIACGSYLLARALLDRSRARHWAADWASVEPVWTRSAP